MILSVTAPGDARLPDGGSYTVSGFKDRNPDTLTRPADNNVRLASDYGDQSQVWSGVDASINARLATGLTVSGGMSTGRTETDNCDILAQVPEAGLLGAPYCHQVADFLTDVKLQTAYTVPRVVCSSASPTAAARGRSSRRTTWPPTPRCDSRSDAISPAEPLT